METNTEMGPVETKVSEYLSRLQGVYQRTDAAISEVEQNRAKEIARIEAELGMTSGIDLEAFANELVSTGGFTAAELRDGESETFEDALRRVVLNEMKEEEYNPEKFDHEFDEALIDARNDALAAFDED